MSDEFRPISEDGLRMVTGYPPQYSLYILEGELDAYASTRTFRWCGYVPEFVYAEQWLATGEVRGPALEIAVTPAKPRKADKHGNTSHT